METRPLSPELLEKMDAYWRTANYLSVGQIYLYDNPLLKRPLTLADVKHMLLGHWGTTAGQNFIYTHLNRVIKKYDLDMIYVSGPGHGGPAVVGNTYLEGTYSEIYPNISQDEAGLRKLFIQFSFPGGIPSHASAECPGSIHEGGELGWSHPVDDRSGGDSIGCRRALAGFFHHPYFACCERLGRILGRTGGGQRNRRPEGQAGDQREGQT